MNHRAPELQADRLRELLHYDPETGAFIRRVTRGNSKAGSIAGSPNSRGYLQIMVDRELWGCHRLAWLYMTGEWQASHIDHRNGDIRDNRWTNLRDVPPIVNQQNLRRPRRGNKTGFLGVHPDRDRFRAGIHADGKVRHLGTFDTAEEAHAAYVKAKRRLHPGCTL